MTRVVPLPDIQAAVDLPRAQQAIAMGFAAYSAGRAQIPPPGELLFDQPAGDAHIKFGALSGVPYFVVKVATGFYDNVRQGLPGQDGVSLVFCSRTGALQCVLLDRGWLTELRTALAGAVAAQHLAPSNVTCIGVLGTGSQARRQIELLADTLPCRRLVVWGRHQHSVESYVRDMQRQGYQVSTADSPDTAFADCQLIITTTAATEPLLRNVSPGTHITAVGADSPAKNELCAGIWPQIDLWVADSVSQCAARGEAHHAIDHGALSADALVELGHIIAGDHPGRLNDQQITVADLTGVAVQDIQIAAHVLQNLK